MAIHQRMQQVWKTFVLPSGTGVGAPVETTQKGTVLKSTVSARGRGQVVAMKIFLMWLVVLSPFIARGRTIPLIVPPQEFSKLPGNTLNCYCNDVIYYHNKLFTTANIGLVEVDDHVVRNLYTWDTSGGGISDGPWVDVAHDLLWVRLGDGRLLNFDGKNWRKSKFPKPMDGDFTRDDIWRGFRGVTDRKTFWIEGAGRVWKFEGVKADKWTQETFPRVSTNSSKSFFAKRVIPCGNVVFYLLRSEREIPIVLGKLAEECDWRQASDIAFCRENGEFTEITNYFGFDSSALLSANNFKDIKAFALKLRQQSDAVSTFLKSKLSEDTRNILESKEGGRLNPLRLQKYLVDDLNSLIRRESIYDPQRFGGVKIDQETLNRLNSPLAGDVLVSLNKALLKAAYPLEITLNHFIAAETAAGRDKAFVLTKSGDLLEVTKQGVQKISTPGVCEAIVASPSGSLLASFGRLGVFELKGEWHKLLECPYAEIRGEYKVHLAAKEQEIALALQVVTGGSEDPLSHASPSLWISQGQEWLKVVLPNSTGLNEKLVK